MRDFLDQDLEGTMRQAIRNERGVALFLALMLMVVVASLALGAITLSSNAALLGKYHAKEAEMRASADAGLEWARDTINGTPAILPNVGFVTLQNAQPVVDALGNVIPGYTRSVFAGRSGSTTNQFGVYSSVISRIDDNAGRAVVVRRAELAQESFSQFARFDDTTLSTVVFAKGIQVFGPIHTNGPLYVGSILPKATFHGRATTASTVQYPSNGIWKKGYKENVARINLPTPADLAALSSYATTANLVVPGGMVGTTVNNPQTRIEFVAVDVNNDGDYTDEDEGFIRVYRAHGAFADQLNYVTARRWGGAAADALDPNLTSPNCGDFVGGHFLSAAEHLAGGPTAPANHNHNLNQTTNRRTSLGSATRACFLGGDPRLTNGWQAAPAAAPHNLGAWIRWPGYGAGNAPSILENKPVHPVNGGGTTGPMGGMVDYLWPINRPFNNNFSGVIYVTGSVAVSGIVRSQVTIAATGNILIADDLTYVTSPGSIPDCERSGGVNSDILGLLTSQMLMIEDNNVNSPFRNGSTSGTWAGYINAYDETADETIHAAVLTLSSVLAENLTSGPTNRETCAGAPVGRGCFNMVGAAIQGKNAGRMSATGYGWNPQWTYDRCNAVKPPPYFPTTGRYFKNRYYEIDPVGFDVAAWFAANQNPGP
jgi:Tfp pilus assembly protein PilX